MRLLTGVLGGLFLACMGTAIVMAIAPPRYQSVGPLIFFAFLTIGCAIAFATRTVARAWRSVFLSAATLAVLLCMVSLVRPIRAALIDELWPIALPVTLAFFALGWMLRRIPEPTRASTPLRGTAGVAKARLARRL